MSSNKVLKNLKLENKEIVILCIGTDCVLFDSFGAIVGSFLKNSQVNAFVYGSLGKTIDAGNLQGAYERLKTLHEDSVFLVVDCCIANSSKELGLVKFFNTGAKVCKGTFEVGNYSILCSTFCIENNKIKNLNFSSIIKYARQVSNLIIDNLS